MPWQAVMGLVAVIAAWIVASGAEAVTCRNLTHEGNRYTICEVDVRRERLRLFRADDRGQPIGQFQRLQSLLRNKGERLAFAMNGGMYHEDRSPVGHYIEDGREEMRVISNPGPGNFGLLPNGVLCIGAQRAQVVETRAYLAQKPRCDHATQSGPMLVIDGRLHPRFLPDSTSRFIRNGVGTSPDGGRAVFAISLNSVTFHEFGRLFRDVLRLPNALFLDGNVSRLYAPDIGRSDLGRRMGPIVAVTEPLN